VSTVTEVAIPEHLAGIDWDEVRHEAACGADPAQVQLDKRFGPFDVGVTVMADGTEAYHVASAIVDTLSPGAWREVVQHVNASLQFLDSIVPEGHNNPPNWTEDEVA